GNLFSNPILDRVDRRNQAPSALMRCARREIFRLAMFLWNTPLPAARCSSGWAARSAAAAASLSPVAIASSTLRRKVRTRERRAMLVLVRDSILRTALMAEGVFAMSFLVAPAWVLSPWLMGGQAGSVWCLARSIPPNR